MFIFFGEGFLVVLPCWQFVFGNGLYSAPIVLLKDCLNLFQRSHEQFLDLSMFVLSKVVSAQQL